MKNRYHYAKFVKNARVNFSISAYCTLFSTKENFKFFEVALSAVLFNGALAALQMYEDIWTFTCFLKTAIKALKQGEHFVQI